MNIYNKLREFYLKNEELRTETLKQILDLTQNINKLSQHLIEHNQKDKSAKRGLLKMLGKRNRLSKYYLKKNLPGTELFN